MNRDTFSAFLLVLPMMTAAWLTGCASQEPKKPVVSPKVASLEPVVAKEQPVEKDIKKDIKMCVAAAQNGDPFEAAKTAAEDLKKQMGGKEPHIILMAECYEEEDLKKGALEGVFSVFPKEKVFGVATYGAFSQSGALEMDAISLLGIGGEGISVATALEENLGVAELTMEKDEKVISERLRGAGTRLATHLPKPCQNGLVILLPDAHSPKNQFLVEGAQEVLGEHFPITGGSANKNAGQTYVYYEGRMFKDSAIALILLGDFEISLAGRQAKENDKVISSAGEGAAEALKNLEGKAFAVFAFNCAGRKGKLDDPNDELVAIQKALGKELPIFGCYCAGEIGPADLAEDESTALSSGVGWHVMFTVLGYPPK